MKDKIEQFAKFLDTNNAIYWQRMGYKHDRDTVTVQYGRKFAKVCTGISVTAFVDMQTGDIYKPASWKAPAPHVRGNILSELNGREAVSSAGHVHYLR